MSLLGLAYLLIALIVSLTLHEFAHAWMGYYLGDDTARTQGRLSLNPLVHIDPIMTVLLPLVLIVTGSPVVFGAARPVPFNPWAVRYGKWGAALVAAAGPAMNIVLAIFFALWLRYVPVAGLAQFFVLLVEINIAFAIFNLIPIPPLDGSRILYAASPPGFREILDNIERMGFIVILVIFLFGWPFIQPLFSRLVGAIVQLLIPGATGLSA
jgi:Zn-dependent protease